MPGVDLHVIRKGRELEIAWNPDSSVARTAERAVLYIKDGGHQIELPIHRTERQRGRVGYTPKSADVDIRVEFRAAGKTLAAESTRILNAANALPQLATPIARAVKPHPPKPIRHRPEPQVPTVEAARVRTKMPAKPPPKSIELIPPVPAENAPVFVPADIRAAITTTITIPVRVTVDENGRVRESCVAPQPNTWTTQLAAIALDAAKRWQFKPATRGGEPVSSAYILNFRFRR